MSCVQNSILVYPELRLLACLLESVSDVSTTVDVYGTFHKHWDKRALKSIIFSRNDSNNDIFERIESQNDKIENII